MEIIFVSTTGTLFAAIVFLLDDLRNLTVAHRDCIEMPGLTPRVETAEITEPHFRKAA